jgi:putative membrane protein
MATAAGGLVIGLAVTPMDAVRAQGNAPGTGTTPGQTAPSPSTPPTSPSNPSTPGDQTNVNIAVGGNVNADGKLIRDVITDNLLEVRLGQIAERKAVNPSVKQFSQRMISDHSRLQNEWTFMASNNGMSVNPQLDNTDKIKVDQLNRLTGPEFDRNYMNMMIQSHQDAVNRLQSEGQSATTAPVRARVANDLPILQQHLSLAQQVGAQVGATTTVATTPTSTPTATPGATNPTSTTTPYYPSATADANVRSDSRFIREVIADNLLEVNLAQLAERKAENSQVKQFAQRMISDHNKLQNDWLSMSSRSGLNLTPGYGKNHRKKLDQLQKLSGRDFDRAYMTLMIQNRKDYVDYFRKEGRGAKSAPVRELVNAGLPVLEQHYSMAKQIGPRVGADPNAVSSRVSD